MRNDKKQMKSTAMSLRQTALARLRRWPAIRRPRPGPAVTREDSCYLLPEVSLAQVPQPHKLRSRFRHHLREAKERGSTGTGPEATGSLKKSIIFYSYEAFSPITDR